MRTEVGPEGQVIIEKAIWKKLGIKPGWITVQFLVDTYVQIHFVPPEHNESVAGILAEYARPELETEKDFNKVCEQAWVAMLSDG